AFTRVELLADHGMQAIAGDHHVGVLRRQGASGPRVFEADADALAVLREPGAAPSGADRGRAGAVEERIEQHALQVAAMDRILRRVVAGEAAKRLAVDQLTEAIEERRLARQHGMPRQLGLEPEAAE